MNQIHADNAPKPVGAYPHARREGEWLFLSGVGPRKAGTTKIPGVTLHADGSIASYDIEVQTRSVIENISTILESAGATLNHVVDVTVFLTNMKDDFPGYNRIYAEYFGKIGATRTTLGIVALPTPIAVEFKVLARIPDGRT